MTTQSEPGRRRRQQAVELLPVVAAAARLGCSDMHVYRLIADGELSAVDIAQRGARRSKTRVRSDDIEAYIDRKTRSMGHANVPGSAPVPAT
jgi:excisionase family DNA binding protein